MALKKTMEIKIDYKDEGNFHIDYGSITPAIAKHLLNSKTLKKIACEEMEVTWKEEN